MRVAFGLLVVMACAVTFGAEGPKYTNRLATEKSPYLLQHAHNPVDWWPWGPEAFAAAKKLNKPIMLSVGYSTCHWCHVMERESFEDEGVARLINEVCIPIKVDREERPDVDRVYMTYVQASTGSGGWPMTVFLTPDGKPFFGGTYFPPEDKDGLPGLKRVLGRVKETWGVDQAKVETTAGKIAEALSAAAADAKGNEATRLDESRLRQCFESLRGQADGKFGGFAPAPKFPQPSNLAFLFHYAARSGENEPREIALAALRGMMAGGIRDHLGGGFHRYSTDERWFLPHFEKMLYDQGQLVSVYLDAYQVTGDEAFAAVARQTLDFVLREMTGAEGNFYSALDADSLGDAAKREKREGAYYVWEAAEIERVMGKEDAAVFGFVYGVKAEGNVERERDPRGEFVGRNVLFLAHDPAAETTATTVGKSREEIAAVLKRCREKLLAARGGRPRPHLDDKTIAAWNGLMISAFARAGRVLHEPKYLEAAGRAADFLVSKMAVEGKEASPRLYRRYRDGNADVAGFADDYAYVTAGLIDLYEASGDVGRLKLALQLQRQADKLFFDDRNGGYFATVEKGDVFLRLKDDGDNAEPAASSVAALNLLRLAAMTDDKAMRERATKTLACFAAKLERYAASMPMLLIALDFSLAKPRQVVLAGDPRSAEVGALLAEVNRSYSPNRVVLFADGGAGQSFLAERLAFIKEVRPVGGRGTAYMCENYACQLPTNDPAELGRQLSK